MLNTNLIVNPDGEASAGAVNFHTVVAPVGWQTTGAFTTVAYDAFSRFRPLNEDDAAAIGGASNYFAGGPGRENSTASQTIWFTDTETLTLIDASLIAANLSGFFGGWESKQDSMALEAIFYDENRHRITPASSVSVGGVSADDRNADTHLLHRETTAFVPAGTRSVDIVMSATITSGSYNDGMADNLSFSLERLAEPPAVPPVNPPVDPPEDLILTGTASADTLTGASGDDTITGLAGADTITTGEGADRIVYTAFRDRGDTITDFQVGSDVIDLSALFAYENVAVSDYADAIAQGYLRISANGATGATIRVDLDGFAGPQRNRPLAKLDNVSVAAISRAQNFVLSAASGPPVEPPTEPPVEPPTEPPLPPEPTHVITGTRQADVLLGTEFADTILGLAGADTITTGTGQDRLVYTAIGDRGDVILDFEVGSDTLVLSELFASKNIVVSSYTEAVTQGHLNIVSYGTSGALIKFDADGIAGPGGSRTLLKLENVLPGELDQAANFEL